MPLVEKGDYGQNPKIPEDYYLSTFSENIKHYTRDDADSLGLVLNFEIDYEADPVELPYFAPGKLSVSDTNKSSRLASDLQNLGLLEPVLEVLEVKDAVMSEKSKWIANDENSVEDLKSALRSVLLDKRIRVQVEDDQDGEESQISKLQKVFEEDEDGDQ